MAYHRNDVGNQRDIEERWSAADSLRIAEAEFYRSRRRAAVRALKLLVEEERLPFFEPVRDNRSYIIAMSRISGIVMPNGSLSRGVPLLPRRMEKAWIESFARLPIGEEGTPFAFRLVDSGLYLEGGANELLRLEIYRAKGEKTILVQIDDNNASGCATCIDIPARPLAC